MDESDHRYNKFKTIGDNAENIFKFLINSMDGWEVIKYGVENHIEVLKEKLKGDYSDIANKIRRMPDYVVLNKEKGIVMFVEVKRTGFIDKREYNKLLFGFQKNLIEECKEYWNEAQLFVVHQDPPYFYIIDIKDIKDEQKQGHESFIGLENAMNRKRPINKWDFHDIQKGIKDVFPEIKEEIIKEASEMIINQISS